MRFFLGLMIFCSIICVSDAQAQTTETGKNEFQIWGGFSPDSSTVFPSGRVKDARLGIVGLRYARRFNNSDTVNLKYTIDAIPVAALSFPDVRFVQNGNTFNVIQERRTSYAYGVAPLGLQANFRPRKKVQPFVGGSGGLLYFNKQTPNFGTRFNFTAEVNGGVEFRLKNNRAVTAGYRYLHISNGGRGDVNPAFDNNVFYVGYSFFR